MSHAYRGALGQTQATTVHVTDLRGALIAAQVYTSIDAAEDPELADQLLDDALNVMSLEGGEPLRLAVPVVYHDPEAELFALVLGDAQRHRELDERIALLTLLRDDPAPVPAYVKEFAVVFGAAGLRALLASRVQPRDPTAVRRDTDQFTAPTELEVDEAPRGLDTHALEVELAAVGEPERGRGRLDTDSDTHGEADGDAAEFAALLPDPLTTQIEDIDLGDDGGGEITAPVASGWHVGDDSVHLLLVAPSRLVRALSGELDVRLVLHRTPHGPVIALALASPAALRLPRPDQVAIATLDVTDERDRGVLHALGRNFALSIDIVARSQRLRRCRVRAPLADNVGYLVRAADDQLRGLGGDVDFARGSDLVRDAGFDFLGVGHAERGEFRADRLAQIATAQQLRRAIAMARRFTRPASEEYLVCTRGFPLRRWHELRRGVVVRAVSWGLWMGAELAQVAVSEGLARSRRDLLAQLERGFDQLRLDRAAFDLDGDAAADNAAAIAREARALGVELRPARANGSGAIVSEAAPVVSGTIGVTPPHGTLRTRPTDELLGVLSDTSDPRFDRAGRVAAAIMLCERAEPRAAAPVINAATEMSRGEAVRVLALAVRFGGAGIPALIDGLTSRKAFVRHGCALALALLRTDDATQAVIGLLLGEPTDLWHDIACAIGQVGSPALALLAARAEGGEPSGDDERLAVAMAEIAARGAEAEVEALASGTGSAAAAVAARAIELRALPGHDAGPAAGPRTERDLTVNHAFSRQFFEALEHGVPGDSAVEPGAAAES